MLALKGSVGFSFCEKRFEMSVDVIKRFTNKDWLIDWLLQEFDNHIQSFYIHIILADNFYFWIFLLFYIRIVIRRKNPISFWPH